MAVNEERARSEVEQLVKELEGANQRLRAYAVQVEELAITKERNLLAREIHDGLGHYLTTIHMQIQAARAVMDAKPAQAQDALAHAQTMTQEALADIRRSVAALRNAPVEDMPLPQVIASLIKDCDGQTMKARMQIRGEPRVLSPQSQWTLYRTAQEGLNNVRKHSHATEVCVELDYTDTRNVTLKVNDNGAGADQVTGGFGLLGLQERVHLVQGEFRVTTQAGQGFLLEVTVPG
jgi:signal transduction histidine kinase